MGRWASAPGVRDHLAPSGDAYLLRVRDDSMIGAHIASGDSVATPPVDDADIVVAHGEGERQHLGGGSRFAQFYDRDCSRFMIERGAPT